MLGLAGLQFKVGFRALGFGVLGGSGVKSLRTSHSEFQWFKVQRFFDFGLRVANPQKQLETDLRCSATPTSFCL